VHSQEIYAAFQVPLDYREQVVGRHLAERASGVHRLRDSLVDRYRAQRDMGLLHDLGANRGQIAAGGKIHDRIGPGLNRDTGLLDFPGHVQDVARGADVGVDFHPQPAPDPQRGDLAALAVTYDDRLARGQVAGKLLGRHSLIAGHCRDLVRDFPRACSFDLRSHVSLPMAVSQQRPVPRVLVSALVYVNHG